VSVPDPWSFVLLALAGWRVWKLIGDDVALDRPRYWVRNRLKPAARGLYWYEFLACPHCLGFWVGVAWWAAWLIFPTGTLIVAVPFAIGAVIGLLGTVWAALSE
jgi:hypothetical protein